MRPAFTVLLTVSAVLLTGVLCCFIGVEVASARGKVEVELSWPRAIGDDRSGLEVVQNVSWQGLMVQLRLPAAFEVKLEKTVEDSPTLAKGQLRLRSGEV